MLGVEGLGFRVQGLGGTRNPRYLQTGSSYPITFLGISHQSVGHWSYWYY